MPRELVRAPGHSRKRSLGVVLAWIEWFCVHGPGDVQGIPLHPRHGEALPLDDEFAGLILDCYTHDEQGRRLYDTVAISRAKGRAKSELAGFVALAEAFAPARFAGWATGGERYVWRDFVYEYEPGEPLGRPVTYPFIRCLATEESQSGNTYDNILYNLEHGPLSEDLPSGVAGMTRIFLPDGGEIRPSTAAAASRDGGKETLAVFDEPHLYVLPELRQMYRTVDRNLRKRRAASPWALLTSTMYQPGENSVLEKVHERAKLIAEGKTRGRRLLLDHREAPAGVDVTDLEQMRAALREVYGPFADVLDLDGIIESEFWNVEKDVEESRRYFFNQPTASRDAWTTHPLWAACADVELHVADDAPMVMFFDGSKSDDATALVGCDVETGHVMTLACWEKPAGPQGEGWQVDRADVDRTVRAVFAERQVVAFFGDVKEFESYIDAWALEFGERLLIQATAGRAAHPVAFGADPTGDPGGWTWTDVTSSIHSQTVTLRRGRSDEASEVAPASMSVQLDNPSGDYTPDHPMGAHYPFVRQGVPARYSVRAGDTHLSVSPTAGARAVTTAAPAVPTDLDVRVEVALDRLPAQVLPGAVSGTPWSQDWQTLMAQYAGPDQYAWLLAVNGNGGISIRWSESGDPTFITGQTVEAIPYVSGQRVAIRATLDTDNSAGGWTMRGYYAPTLAGPWTLLGEDTGDATTEVAQSTAPIELGDIDGSSITPGTGRYYAAEVRDGIDGDPLASPDFTAAEPGATQVTDAQGNVWDIQDGAEITDWRPLLVGTVDEWAPSWPHGDLSDPDDPEERPGEARVDITISGILRRLGQGQQALESTLRRRIPSYNPLAYWPMEDGEGATQAYSPIPGVQPMRADALDFGADSTLPGSQALPAITEDSRIHGFVPPPDSAQTSWSCEFVMAINEPPTNRSTVMRYIGTGRVKVWSLQLEASSGDARILGEDDDGNVVIDQTAGLGDDVTSNVWTRWQFFAEQDGSSVDYTMRWIRIGGTSGQVTGSYTGALGRIRVVQSPSATFNNALTSAGMRLGHVAVFSPKNETAYNEADHGFTGEGAIDRMRRLAVEEHLPLSVVGRTSESPDLGPQRPATLLELLRECAAADGGILTERRDALGLQYRPRYLLYNQQPALVLDAAENEVDHPFAPTLDDQRLRNDVTVTRTGGSSARVVDDDSVAVHSIYDDSITVNVETDGQLEPIAAWRLHRGTWPGMRYPAVTTALDLAPQTIDTWLDREPGDRVQVVGLPPQHPTGTVDLLVEGVTHTISPTRWTVEAATSPAGPWTVGEVGGDDPGDDTAPTHIDTDGSRLVAAVDEDDTQLVVLAYDGPAWCTTAGPSITAADGDLPFDVRVGGEDMTVSSIEPLLWDDFERTVPSGWGAAPDAFGFAWQTAGGAESDRSVALGTARVSLPDTTIRFQYLPAFATDCEILTQVIVPALATGGSLRAGIIMRISGAAYYQLRVNFQTSGSVGLDILNSGSITDSISAVGQQYTAGSTWWIRARVVNNTVYGRAWLDGTPEPGWRISDTITSGTVESGLVGVTAARAPSNANVNPIFQFTRWELVRPQLFTVTRGANGVAKSHALGDDVRLAHPIIVAL